LKESDFEVDFIVFEKNKIRKLIQVCWSLSDEKTRQREVQGLVKACHKYNLNTGIILTYDDEVEFIEDGITIECIPVYKWLLSNKI
jgi:predicted AAA+ superfamily ATPase